MSRFTWTKLEPQVDAARGSPCARSSHGVCLVQNGSRLIIYGGEFVARTPLDNQQICWAVDSLQPSEKQGEGTTPSWRWIDASNGPPDRIAHAQAVYDDKFVYIFGGRAGTAMQENAMNDLWKLDCSGAPGTEVWSQILPHNSEHPEPRSFHRMVCIGTCLYVFGGCGGQHDRLSDLWKFDITTSTWHNLGTSKLRGRGGPNFVALSSGQKLGVVAGFAGEEMADGQIFDLASNQWSEDLMEGELEVLRPRSVCVAATIPSAGVAVIFGGEVDPSDRGHEGAGGFENDLVVLDEKTGALKASSIKASSSNEAWPGQRGWADCSAYDNGDGTGYMYIFGGLSGDDENPTRMDDLWRLEVRA